VELIVLNVGLSAGILDTRTFSMFVLHALILTFITTPLTLAFYPERIRGRINNERHTSPSQRDQEMIESSTRSTQELLKTHFSVALEKIEQLPAVMTFIQLLQLPSSAMSSESSLPSTEKATQPVTPPGLPYVQTASASSSPRLTLDALRLIELTNRTSAVLKSHFADSLVHSDPVLSVVRTFSSLNRMAVSTALAIVGYEDLPSYVAEHVKKTSSQMLILPWSPSSSSFEDMTAVEGSSTAPVINTVSLSSVQAQTFRKLFLSAPNDVALFVDRGLPHDIDTQAGQHIFFPFVGGPDDRLALSFVMQLCMNPSTTATIVRFAKNEGYEMSPVNSIEKPEIHHTMTVSGHHILKTHIDCLLVLQGIADTVYAMRDTQTRLASDTADNVQWERYTSGSAPEVAGALDRVTFSQETAPRLLSAILDASSRTFAGRARTRMIIVLGRSRRMAIESHATELRELLSETGAVVNNETTKMLGDVGTAFVAKGMNASLLVLQASCS
jgi:hypothetical protein